jgi:hypothetical protein
LRRELVRRERDDVLRDFAGPAGFLAAGLRAADERLLALEDFAREVLAFFAVPLFAAERLAVDRFAVERLAVDFREPLLRVELDDDFAVPPELALALPSIVHLPVMTR